jgi:hypothetical protein
VTGCGRRRYCALPVAARDADSPNFPLLGLLGYFVFAYGYRTGDDRSLTLVTTVNRDVKILFLHLYPSNKKIHSTQRLGSNAFTGWSQLLCGCRFAVVSIVSNFEQTRDELRLIHESMATKSTVLCIHRDPRQLTLLKEKGYGVVMAASGCEGLRLLMTQPVDAVVLEYYLGLLDGSIVADEIKQVKPHLPVLMMADPWGLPHGALESVDTLVDKADGPHFLWAALHFLLTTKVQQNRSAFRVRTMQGRRRDKTGTRKRAIPSNEVAAAYSNEASPFSPEVWKGILDGTVQF